MNRSETWSSRTKLIIFLGTPHRGSPIAGWGEIASNLVSLALQDSNKNIIKTLEVNGEVLDNIHESFKHTVERNGTRIHSFQESRAISGVKGLNKKVVEDFSSKLDLSRLVETVESIDADHTQMFVIAGRPPYYYIPFLRNRRFVGRSAMLEEIADRLFVSQKCQKLALVGLGGIGKTQLALEFAYTVKDRWPEYSIFWIPALSMESFEQAYREIAIECSIPTENEENDLKISVRRYLSKGLAGKWLLIVDNADDQEILAGQPDGREGIVDYLPQNEDSLTLFTTRHKELAVWLANSHVVELGEMDPQEALDFLQSSMIDKEALRDEEVTTQLLDELAFLPLAISQAAAYLNTLRASVQEYLLLLRGTEQDMARTMSREFPDNTRYRNAQNAVASTLLVSFQQIQKSDPTAADLLAFIACIEQKAIPRSIMPDQDLIHAIGTLCSYGFLASRGESNLYDMHRLVHVATKVWIRKADTLHESKEKAIRQLANIYPQPWYNNQTIWQAYLPHGLRLLDDSKEVEIKEKEKLCMKVGKSLRCDARYNEAIKWLSTCLGLREARLGERDPLLLSSQHELAIAYGRNGQAPEAIELLEKIVDFHRNTLAEDDHRRLLSQYELAVAYNSNKENEKATGILEHVVEIRGMTLAEDNPSRLASQRELAAAYRKNGQLEEAIELLEHVVKISNDTLREDHPALLASQHELATAYLDNKQIEEAIEILEHVVEIEKDALREDHPDLLTSQHELAIAYYAIAKRYSQKALDLLERVVEISQSTMHEGHPRRVASEKTLAYFQRKQQKKGALQRTGRTCP
ncbi:MAG: hypothetical protein Q9227_005742 [Pyrenula ochraceoflavens]